LGWIRSIPNIRLRQQGYSPACPYTPGFDAAGVVEAVGKGVSTVRIRIVGRELPLAEAAQAHHIVMESSAYGKTVFVP